MKRYSYTSFWIFAALAVFNVARAIPRIFTPNIDVQAAGYRSMGVALVFGLVAFLFLLRNRKADAACDAAERQRMELEQRLLQKLREEQSPQKKAPAPWDPDRGDGR